MAKNPVRLKNPPLTEAVFEIRFSSSKGSIGDLLPGLLYSALGEQFGEAEPLPMASVPSEIRVKEPRLRYKPHVRLSGEDAILLVGHQVATLSRSAPYLGWKHFRNLIDKVLSAVKGTELVDRLERYSLKYVNLIELQDKPMLDLLNADLQLKGFSFADNGFRLRAEITLERFISIIELASTMTMQVGEESKSGLLFSIDTLTTVSEEESWSSIDTDLETGHEKLKEVFFGLLKPDTIKRYGPIWSEK